MTYPAASLRLDFMKRPVQLGIASLKALATVMALGAVSHAALPYLPLIGPPPMRVLAVKRPVTAVVKFAATPVQIATNPPVLAGAPISPGATNLTGGRLPAAPEPLIGANLDRSAGDGFSASVFALPTPNLLGISPQALAAYFRPVSWGTNSVGPIGLLPVSFVPPLPPDKSSQAEYIIK